MSPRPSGSENADTEGDGVGGQGRQVLRQVGEGEEALLDGDVEGIAILEVCGD